MTKASRVQYAIKLVIFITILIFHPSNSLSKVNKLSVDSTLNRLTSSEVIYTNPRVYNVDYSFELVPDPAKIDRDRDLKVRIPIPREWESQKGVKIISVQPPPHAKYEEPEHGNRMLFWDFGKEPEKASYKVNIKYRLESYDILTEVDPNEIDPYDNTSKEYALYTRSQHTICITLKIKQMAQEAVGDEKNPYLQAKQRLRFSVGSYQQRQSGYATDGCVEHFQDPHSKD